MKPRRSGLILILLMAAACESPREDAEFEADTLTTTDPDAMSSKIGATLRHTLRAGGEDPIAVLVQVDTAMAADAAARLREVGFEIRTASGDVYAANATPEAIRQAADLPFIKSIERSEER